MDQFAQLRAFVRTVEQGSQAGAARELGLTPAMVGRQVRALEDRLGARLLNRTTTRQSLTEAGAEFHARAVSVLDQLEAAMDSVGHRQAGPSGRLRLSAPVVFGTQYLAAWLAEFQAATPQVQIELSLNDRRVDLVEEGYDAALRIGRLHDTSLVARRLAPCRVLVCAAPSYLRRRGTPADPLDLRAHDCLVYAYAAHGSRWSFVDEAGTMQSVDVEGSFTANNGDALLTAAIAGAGIVTQPSFIAADALRSGALVPLLPGWRMPELTIYAIYPSARYLPLKVRAFVDFIAAKLGNEPPWEAAP